MQVLFLKLLELSLTGSLFALAVMLIRLLFRKTPRWIFCVLWGIVALRLLLPISIESSFSAVPESVASGEIISGVGGRYVGKVDVYYENNAGYADAVDAGRQPVYSNEGYYVVTEQGTLEAPTTVGETIFPVLSWIWVTGMAAMLVYLVISYLLLRRKMAEATLLRENIWQCERVESPFVLGFIRPRIYLPYAIKNADMSNVIAHEQAHIQRKDHWWKPLGFALLAVYWFNPVLWVAYILLCRDIEAACDEKVISHMEKDQKRAYSTALLNCSVHRRRIAACPLAFGEVGVKERVKRVMNYKKPAFWMIVAAVVVCAVVAVCFLTSPVSRTFEMSGSNVRDLDVEVILERIDEIEDVSNSDIYMNANNFSLQIDSRFDWVDSQAIRYFHRKDSKDLSGQIRIFPEEQQYVLTKPAEWIRQDHIYLLRHYLEAVKYLPQEEIRRMAPADRYLINHVQEGAPEDYERVISYTAKGVGETDGWFIHLRLDPLHADGEGFSGTGEEVVHLFYYDEATADYGKLIDLVDEIAYNPDCAASSNPFTFIEAKKARYNEILTYGGTAVECFVKELRTGENGLRGYIMAVACGDITGIGDKDAGADWATAQEWLALYDRQNSEEIVPPVLATDYISGKQARLLSFNFTFQKPNQYVIACGIAPWQGDYGENNTLVLDGENGQNQILLAPKGFSVSRYKIYLPDGTVYDDGTRTPYDSLGSRVMYSEKGVCLIAPFQTGEYIYEVVLSWPEQGLEVTYGLKVVMTGEESDYDRALRNVFRAYGDGNPLIAVSLVDKYTIANGVSSSPRYLFKVENIPYGPIYVEVSQHSGEIITEKQDPDKWLVDPPYVGNQGYVSGDIVERRPMTLPDVIALSKLGMDLTWEDLVGFEGRDIGSGLFVIIYEIDPEFYLLVGDGKTTGKPMYAELNSVSRGASCDIRQQDAEAFIRESKKSALDYAIYKAIIAHNAEGTFPDAPDGLLPTAGYRIFGIETLSGTPLENQTNHMEETTVYLQYAYTRYYHSGGALEVRSSTCTPAVITFSVDPVQGYTLKAFWEPNPGSTYREEIREKFPKGVADAVLDPYTDGYYANDLQSRCLSRAVSYLAEISGEAGSGGTPVAWIYEKDGGTGTFRFQFDIPYTGMEISCDHGQLIDADHTGNKKIGTSLTVGQGNALYWAPLAGDDLYRSVTITFRLLDGTREVYSGSILLTGRDISGSDAYIATLVCDGLRMDVNSDAVGAMITLIEE